MPQTLAEILQAIGEGCKQGDRMTSVLEQKQLADNFVQQNLFQLCKEMISFAKSGILETGKMRELIALCAFAGHSDMALAESMVKQAAVEMIADKQI